MMESSNLCIVLRAVNYRDNDRMLTLFSRGEGKVTAKAAGARRMKSGLSVASQPFCCAEYEFYARGGKRYVRNALVKEKFFNIQNDYDKYTAGCVMLELSGRIIDHTDEWERLFSRLINTLYAMETGKADAARALAYFLVHAIDIMGIFPATDFCASCGKKIDEAVFWNAAQGGALCPECAAVDPARRIPPEITKYFTVLRHIKPEVAESIMEDGLTGELTAIAREYIELAGDIKVRAAKYLEP